VQTTYFDVNLGIAGPGYDTDEQYVDILTPYAITDGLLRISVDFERKSGAASGVEFAWFKRWTGNTRELRVVFTLVGTAVTTYTAHAFGQAALWQET
jgi:hypothetical protein